MGNAIAKKCDVPKAATGSAGHCSLWELRNGKNRENNEDITLWTFDKADLGNFLIYSLVWITILSIMFHR